MLIFVDGGEPGNPEENPLRKDVNLQQTQYTLDAGALAAIEPSHNVYCAILTCFALLFKNQDDAPDVEFVVLF